MKMIKALEVIEDLHFATIKFISPSGKIEGNIIISRKEFRKNYDRLENFLIEEINKDIND
jgi:hypothetical protein